MDFPVKILPEVKDGADVSEDKADSFTQSSALVHHGGRLRLRAVPSASLDRHKPADKADDVDRK